MNTHTYPAMNGNGQDSSQRVSIFDSAATLILLRRRVTLLLGMVALGASLGLIPSAVAAPLIPAGLKPGDTYHLIFATSTLQPGNFGGIAAGDNIVNTLANVTGTKTATAPYRAILSDSTSDAINLTSFLSGGGSPIYNTQGQLVSNSYANMFLGSATALVNPIRYDEFGNGVNLGSWTGTDSSGLHNGNSFSDWTGGPGPGTRGGVLLTSSQWVNSGANSTHIQALRLYGISSMLTVPVPEPSSAALIGLLGAGVSGVVGRRSKGS